MGLKSRREKITSRHAEGEVQRRLRGLWRRSRIRAITCPAQGLVAAVDPAVDPVLRAAAVDLLVASAAKLIEELHA